MFKSKRMKFGLIGGGMAGPLSAGALNDIKEAELVAFADIKEDVCKNFCKKYNIKDWYTDYKEILQRDDIDAVYIATPPYLHEEMVVSAAKAGKHVMCEKPIAINLLEADRMIQACEEANVTFGVIVMCRYYDAAEKIKKALDEKRLGKILLVTLTGKSFRNDEYYASGAWRGMWKGEGGGSLMSQTIHFIDLMLYFIGEVDSLSGSYMTTIHKDIEVDDMAVAQFKFKNGAIGVLDSSTAVIPGYPRILAIHGEKGTIIMDEDKIKEWKVEGMNEEDFISKDKEAAKTITRAGYVETEFHRRQLLDFMKAIVEGKKQRFDATDERIGIELIRAIYQSGDTGKEVKFPVIDREEYGKETRM